MTLTASIPLQADLAYETPPHKNVLVIKLGALGDFIQALGPMAAIRRHHPDADITLLTTQPYVSFGLACGYVNRVWTDSKPGWTDVKGWLSFRKKLTSAGFDRVYDLQNNDRTALYLRLFPSARRPEWVGAASGASHRNNSPERTAGHAIEGHIQTLALAGIHDVVIDDLRWVEGNLQRFMQENGLRKPYVLLVPGASPERPEKRWPAQNYAQIARLIDGWGFQPVIIGTRHETFLAETICRTHPATIDLTGKTALFDIAVLARHAAGAIGNDTGPMHMIAPTGCPSLVLFSKHSNPVRHAPCGPIVKTHQVEDLSTLSVDDVTGFLSARWFRQ
ncbi:MAG: glycosyltransferase family 9 protein [Micavibrio aeruginosavorus]|uniref:Glycosyltransferase family 9 protein n=1 Tax=Micavibrio aeruginosavorus TaxID=349221 RepID=A0A7T5R2N8_9BACT|nr:MAG: glycosyltransferase family 9 protein [Micavibrio aeruginosavorus]